MFDSSFQQPLSLGQRWSLIAACAIFLVLAGYRLEAPGLYADEAIFVPVAYRALGECGVDASITKHWGECFPMYMNPPYIGPLKAWLYAPLLAVADPTPALLRWPMILLSLGALLVLFRCLRRELDTSFALAALLLCALDPVYVFHSRFDSGPFVIANLCKLGILASFFWWLREGRARELLTALLLALLGLYDKLNFLWLIAAFGGAGALVYWREAWRYLRIRPAATGIPIALFALTLIYVMFRSVLPAMQMQIEHLPAALDLSVQRTTLQYLYNETFGATSAQNWIFQQKTATSLWPAWLLTAQVIGVALLAGTRPWRDTQLRGRWRVLLFLSIAILLLLTQMLFTRQLGGAHHLVALWPLPHLQLLMLLDLAWRHYRASTGKLAPPHSAAWLGVIALLVLLIPRHAVYLAGWRGELGYEGRFDPNISVLSKTLNALTVQTIVSVDWGLHHQLVALAEPSRRHNYRDGWPVFHTPWDAKDTYRTEWKEQNLAAGASLFLTFAPGREVLADWQRHLPQFLAHWGGCLRLMNELPGHDGRPLYRIWRYAPNLNCAIADFQR